MRIRHIIAQADVDDQGRILAPERARHGVIVGGRIDALAGEIDPLTHLNLDFPDHRLEGCLVAESLEVGAKILADDEGWLLAFPGPSAFTRRGPPNIGARQARWQQ